MASILTLGLALAAAKTAEAIFIDGDVIAPCDSPIYCHGEILKEIELAQPFSDSKTFVDMPATKPLDEIQAAFDNLTRPISNNTELQDFLSENFAMAGSELEEVAESDLETDPAFLDDVDDAVISEFATKVIDIWPSLTRRYTPSTECEECPNSYIPINRTFVIAGGRFREPYYWDSYWILEGLLRTGGSFVEISKNQIENFLDFVETYGFVPNGARLYFLNRSQPPLLAQMVRLYVDYTNDTSILERAVPLLIQEHQFWMNNRTVDITKDGEQYTLNRYAVLNTQPRPESYREDYITANNQSYYASSGIIYPEQNPLNASEQRQLYGNLATGAESGWDYSSRWIARPQDAADDVYFPLRYLNTKDTIPVELNSILYGNEMTIADFLIRAGNVSEGTEWLQRGMKRSQAMYSLFWNETYYRYFDYNMTSGEQNLYVPKGEAESLDGDAGAPEGMQVYFHVAQFYPFWMGAAPLHLKSNPLAVQRAFAPVAEHIATHGGGVPATNLETGQQWDKPNVWPPLQHILMKGLLNTPASFGTSDPAWNWTQTLALDIAQRYLNSTFCTWYATGGSTSETPRLEGFDDDEAEGIMFEKYSDNSTNVAGGGGEYEVVEGFGWTNGVLLWTIDEFKNKGLRRPDCGDIEAADVNGESAKRRRSMGRRAVELDPADAKWVKKFGRKR